MTDKFGRHKSTRWVRASVPSYGDEWNDDDGYDYGSISEDSNEQDEEPVRSPLLNQVPPEKFVLPGENKDDNDYEDKSQDDANGKDMAEADKRSDGNKLVLSIDNLRDHDSDNDSNSDLDDPQNLHESDEGMVKSQTVTVDTRLKPELFDQPPTPSHNMETPSSEQSFQSDDSIQHEPTALRVAGDSQKDSFQGHDQNGGYDNIIEEYPDKEETPKPELDGHDLGTENADSEMLPSESDKDKENLVLSIDNRNLDDKDSEEDSDQDDFIPYYEKQTHDIHRDDDINASSDDSSDFHHSSEPNHTRNKSDALDSLINDLQSASLHEDGLPKMDSIQNITLPDFENYYEYDDSEEEKPVTPIAPLSTADEKSYHEKYLTELSGHKPSIRKPPKSLPSMAASAKEPSLTNSRSSSVRKPPESLVSPTYSTFGDAVEAYMSDRGSEQTQKINTDDDEDYSNTDSEKREFESPEAPEMAPASSEQEAPESDQNNLDKDQSQMKTSSSAGTLGMPATESNTSELHPVTSSGSLSTGKHSFDQRSDFPEPPPSFDRDITRRDSTMSTNTFSMGSWKPNTNNFRDQFINDNDNDSNYNFSLDTESSTGYQKFTKPRNISSSDTMSLVSSVSMPETVDVPLPSIHEDPNDNDNDIDKDDTFSSGDTNKDDIPSQGLGISSSNMTSDSILNEHEYDKGKFQEEMSSKESLSKDQAGGVGGGSRQQRYASLLPPISDDNASTDMGENTTIVDSNSMVPSISISNSNNEPQVHKRVESDSSTFTQGTRKTFPPNAYPVSNWKTIMKPSQSIDRINLLRDALEKEIAYDTGLQTWLSETLTKSNNSSNIHIGRIASEAYQNATHSDLRRHASIRSRVSSVKDKVETGGLHASNLGKKFFSRGKKLMRSSS